MAPKARTRSARARSAGSSPSGSADRNSIDGRRFIARLADFLRPLRARQGLAPLIEQDQSSALGQSRQDKPRFLRLALFGASCARLRRFPAGRRPGSQSVRPRSVSRLKYRSNNSRSGPALRRPTPISSKRKFNDPSMATTARRSRSPAQAMSGAKRAQTNFNCRFSPGRSAPHIFSRL